jgi:hypothetical protein
MMTKTYLTDLNVLGFRPFQRLELNNLARVNLVVGKNSLGKTSLLEAISIFSAEGSPARIRDLLVNRGEISLETRSDPDSDSGSAESFSYESLFYGRPDLMETCPSFSIEGKYTERLFQETLTVTHCQIIDEVDQAEDGRVLRTRRVMTEGDADFSGRAYPGLSIQYGDRERLVSFGRIENFRRLRSVESDAHPGFQFVPAEGLGSDYVSLLWDKIALREEEGIVYEALRLICKDLERVAFVGSPRDRLRSYGRFALVKIGRHAMPVPLRSLGEGVNHLFGIAVSLAAARNGFLLIDEVENGVHYSVMKDLWALILKQSQDLNVQVFATTHSLDCIRGFEAAASGLGAEDASLIRLEGVNGVISGVSFEPDELNLVVEKEIEVRCSAIPPFLHN